jgi:hypothetical protein
MPAREGRVRRASGQSNIARRFIDTRGESTLGIAICQRCQTKRKHSELIEDGNIKKFYVCRPTISPGCWDSYDPFRLPPPKADDLRLPFVRPDTPLTVPLAEQGPLHPPSPTDDENP